MAASGKPEVEALKREIDRRKKELDDLKRKRRDAKKRHQGLLTLLGIVLVTLFVTSSCSLHAGQLLGRWDAEQVLSAVIDPVLGFVNKFKEINTALYVIASVLATVLMLPVNLLVAFPYGFLKLGAGILELTVPPVLPFVPYVEVGFVLLVFVRVTLWTVSGIHADNRSVRADVRAIDAEIRECNAKIREYEAKLRACEADESAQPADLGQSSEDQEEMLQWRAQAAWAKRMLPQYIPADVPFGYVYNWYVIDDPERMVEVARTLNMAMTNHVFDQLTTKYAIGQLTLSPDGEIGSQMQAYLDAFETLFEDAYIEDLKQMQASIQQQEMRRQLEELAYEVLTLPGEDSEEPEVSETPGTFRGKHAR